MAANVEGYARSVLEEQRDLLNEQAIAHERNINRMKAELQTEVDALDLVQTRHASVIEALRVEEAADVQVTG